MSVADAQLAAIYQELILDHYRRPRNKGALEGADARAERRNPLCGDEITLEVAFDGDVVRDVRFSGRGCSISQASASMMTAGVKGHDLEEARTLTAGFREMMTGSGSTDGLGDNEDMEALQGVKKFPVRVKCALLPWTALEEAIQTWQGAQSAKES
jgi:nitrogen fixation NifU-like protein